MKFHASSSVYSRIKLLANFCMYFKKKNSQGFSFTCLGEESGVLLFFGNFFHLSTWFFFVGFLLTCFRFIYLCSCAIFGIQLFNAHVHTVFNFLILGASGFAFVILVWYINGGILLLFTYSSLSSHACLVC